MERAKVISSVKKKGMSLGAIKMEGPGKGRADRVHLFNRMKISMNNKGPQSGDFEIRADEIKFERSSDVLLKSSGPEGPSFKVKATSFELISSDVECLTTANEGEGGGNDVEADSVLLKGYLRTTAGNNKLHWDLFPERPNMRMGAKGGDISIKAKDFQIESWNHMNGTRYDVLDNGTEPGLFAIATSSGDAGNIDVQCRLLKMKGGSIFSWTKVFPDGGPVTNAGRSGDITI